MVTSRVQKFVPPIEEVKETPPEVLRLKSLIEDNGWKMLIERIDEIITSSTKTLAKPLPLGLSKDERDIYYEDLEKIKMKLLCYDELKSLPEQMIKEYEVDSFVINNTEQV